MEALDAYWLNAKTYIGQTMDIKSLVEAIKLEDMLPLTAEEISQHEQGLFAVTGKLEDKKIDGYVACKEILDIGPVALIGGLYVTPEHRGRGLATELVRRITKISFDTYPDVAACVANCNPGSAFVFGRLGYNAIGLRDDNKMRYEVGKDAWLAQQNINDDL